MDNSLSDIIYKKELILANRLTKDAGKYLSSEFIEYGSSGNVSRYDELIEHYKNCKQKNYVISDFNIAMLSDKTILATYISELDGKRALRSSIWRLEDKHWKMFFHQGTPTK